MNGPTICIRSTPRFLTNEGWKPHSHYTGALDALAAPRTSLALLHLSDASLRRAEAVNPFLLILTQPRLGGLAQDTLSKVINEMPDHNERKCDGIHPVHTVVEDSNADNDAPEVARQERDVLERGAGEAIQNGDQGVEERENQRVSGQVASNFAVPGRFTEGVAIKDGSLHAVDDGGPEPQLSDHLVQGPARDEPFLVHIAQPVAGRTEHGKEVSLQLVAAADVTTIGPREVV